MRGGSNDAWFTGFKLTENRTAYINHSIVLVIRDWK